MVGDTDGSKVSKEYLLQLINEETKIVCAKFPNTVRAEYTVLAPSRTASIIDVFGDEGPSFVIKKLLVDGTEFDVVGADEAERMVQG